MFIIVGGAADQTLLCKYSKGVTGRTRGHLKRVALAEVQAESEGAQKESVRTARSCFSVSNRTKSMLLLHSNHLH